MCVIINDAITAYLKFVSQVEIEGKKIRLSNMKV